MLPPYDVTEDEWQVAKARVSQVQWTASRVPTIWELFEQVINKNGELSLLEKFHCLRASVTGDAAAVLAGLPPTSLRYGDAIQILKRRFGNEEFLIQEHLKKLLDLQGVRCFDDVRRLRRLYDVLAWNIRGLEAVGRK